MSLFGLKVSVSPLCVARVWQFPKDRFIEYEPSDEWWCRKYGFGQEVEVPACYRVGNDLHIHPVLWEQFKKQTKEKAP